jgi:hypothetical protein
MRKKKNINLYYIFINVFAEHTKYVIFYKNSMCLVFRVHRMSQMLPKAGGQAQSAGYAAYGTDSISQNCKCIVTH